MPRILIFGAGGVGAIYAYILDKAGAEVTTICRSNFSEAKDNGFSISSEVFGCVHVKPGVVNAVADAQGDWDFVVITSKASVGVKPSVSDLIASAVGSSTTIVVAQNGIEIEQEYAAAFPGSPIVSGVIYLPTTQTSPGKIQMGNLERLEIGTYPHDAPAYAKQKAEEFASLFHRAGATCNVYDDIQEKRWSKLMVNASWNPICALSQSSDADFLRSSKGAGGIVKEVMLEVVALAKAHGYNEIDEQTAEWQLSRAKERMDGVPVEPSMLTDVRFGRTLEVEAIVGNTVRIANRLGIETPMLSLIYALASALNSSINRAKSS